MKHIYPDWKIHLPDNPTSCILALPGRCQKGEDIADWVDTKKFKNTLVVGVTPYKLEWYPMPWGANDQQNALDGIEPARLSIENVLWVIQNRYGIPRSKTLLYGYSAGAVMSIEVASKSKEPFAGVIVQSGAILEPRLMCENINNTPYLLIHGANDNTFSWPERFLPMYRIFQKLGYKFEAAIRDGGGHMVYHEDSKVAENFISRHLGYPDEIEEFGESIKNNYCFY